MFVAFTEIGFKWIREANMMISGQGSRSELLGKD